MTAILSRLREIRCNVNDFLTVESQSESKCQFFPNRRDIPTEFAVWFLVDVLLWGIDASGLKIVSIGKFKILKLEPNWVAGFGAVLMIVTLIIAVCIPEK